MRFLRGIYKIYLIFLILFIGILTKHTRTVIRMMYNDY